MTDWMLQHWDGHRTRKYSAQTIPGAGYSREVVEGTIATNQAIDRLIARLPEHARCYFRSRDMTAYSP